MAFFYSLNKRKPVDRRIAERLLLLKKRNSEMGDKYEENPVDKKSNYYKDWRTYQMSYHLPKWVEVKIDFGEKYLTEKSKP